MLRYSEKVLNFKVKVPSAKKEYVFRRETTHLTIQEICNRLCDKLGMDLFTSTITITKEYSYVPLSPMNTIQQCGVKNNDVLVAQIVLTSDKGLLMKKPVNLYLPDEEIAEYYPKYRIGTYGLTLTGVCSNRKCIERDREVQIPLGSGKFDFEKIIAKTKCPSCPYRDLDVNPPIQVRDLKFVNCFWKYEGIYKDNKDGQKEQKSSQKWFRIEGEDSKQFYKILAEEEWIDLTIIVKIM